MGKSMIGRRMVVAALLASVAGSGCTQTVKQRVAWYEPGAVTTAQPVPRLAYYKVKVRERDGKLHGIDGTERWLHAGETVGFQTDDAGVVHALAREEVIPLALRPHHDQLVWHSQYEQQTQFAKEVGEVLATAGEVAIGAAALGLVGLAIGAQLAPSDDDDCDDGYRWKRKRHRR